MRQEVDRRKQEVCRKGQEEEGDKRTQEEGRGGQGRLYHQEERGRRW